MNAFLQVAKGKPFFFFFLLWWITKQGFIWVKWTALLSPGWNCSLWSGGSVPAIFLAYVSCFLYRSEWPQFIVSYRWRAYFEIRYHSVSGFRRPVCSTCSYIPLSLTCEGRVSLRPLLASSVNKDLGRWQKRPGCHLGAFFFLIVWGNSLFIET